MHLVPPVKSTTTSCSAPRARHRSTSGVTFRCIASTHFSKSWTLGSSTTSHLPASYSFPWTASIARTPSGWEYKDRFESTEQMKTTRAG